MTQYLLEKSRIVTQATDERNYHVFYELLAGLDQQLRDKYGLLTPDKYFYLNQVRFIFLPSFLFKTEEKNLKGFPSQYILFKITKYLCLPTFSFRKILIVYVYTQANFK